MADKPLYTRKFNENIDLGRKMGEGGILATLYMGVQGNDEEAAKSALENMLFKKLVKEENVSLLEVNVFDIIREKSKKKGEKFFSGVAEVKLVADDFRWFVNIIMRYGPSAVEIVEPTEVKLNAEQMHSMVADVSDFVHMYSQQIIAMFKDPERAVLYDRMLKGE
ncbi:MAG: hypothetical protein V1875_01700 [Candidatus Altiarchaeota archaeon]